MAIPAHAAKAIASTPMIFPFIFVPPLGVSKLIFNIFLCCPNDQVPKIHQ